MKENSKQKNKKYLFPAGGAYFQALAVAVLLLCVLLYSLISDPKRFFMIGIVEGPFLCALISLVHVTLVESNMIVLSAQHLFFYGMDNAELMEYSPLNFKELLERHHALFNKTDVLEQSQKSHYIRKLFYLICLLFMVLGLATTCCNFLALVSCYRLKLFFACILMVIDFSLLINRLFFRTSIRCFWAKFHSSIAEALAKENNPRCDGEVSE